MLDAGAVHTDLVPEDFHTGDFVCLELFRGDDKTVHLLFIVKLKVSGVKTKHEVAMSDSIQENALLGPDVGVQVMDKLLGECVTTRQFHGDTPKVRLTTRSEKEQQA